VKFQDNNNFPREG